jgi:hypothetical protein
MVLLWTMSLAEAGVDRGSWLQLYDSPEPFGNSSAVAYVYGMANGLTIAEAYDCGGVELSGNELAATVAVIVRKGFELPVAVPMALTVHRCRTVPGGVFGRTR